MCICSVTFAKNMFVKQQSNHYNMQSNPYVASIFFIRWRHCTVSTTLRPNKGGGSLHSVVLPGKYLSRLNFYRNNCWHFANLELRIHVLYCLWSNWALTFNFLIHNVCNLAELQISKPNGFGQHHLRDVFDVIVFFGSPFCEFVGTSKVRMFFSQVFTLQQRHGHTIGLHNINNSILAPGRDICLASYGDNHVLWPVYAIYLK